MFLLLILFSQSGLFSLARKGPCREAVVLRYGLPARARQGRASARQQASEGMQEGASAWQQAHEGCKGASAWQQVNGGLQEGASAWQQASEGMQRGVT